MKFKLESSEDSIDIEIADGSGKQDRFLAAFRESQQGRCSCPTRGYGKPGSLEIAGDDDRIRLQLKSKPGMNFDEAEIGKCLDYTRARLNDEA